MNVERLAHNRFEQKVDRLPGRDACWLWTGATGEYGRGVFIEDPGPPRKVTAAQRFAYRFYVGPIPPERFPIAKCGRLDCVSPHHLVLRTQSEVTRSAYERGTLYQTQFIAFYPPPALWGERNGNSRYPDALVSEIRRERSAGAKLEVIALRRKIPVSTVAFLCSHRKGAGNVVPNKRDSVPQIERRRRVWDSR